MTIEEIEAAIAVHKAAIDALEAMRQTRASSTPATPAPATARKQPTATRPRWELAATAFRRFPFQEHTIRRICSDHPAWAVKLRDGAWYVDADLFDEFAARVERGEPPPVCANDDTDVRKEAQKNSSTEPATERKTSSLVAN